MDKNREQLGKLRTLGVALTATLGTLACNPGEAQAETPALVRAEVTQSYEDAQLQTYSAPTTTAKPRIGDGIKGKKPNKTQPKKQPSPTTTTVPQPKALACNMSTHKVKTPKTGTVSLPKIISTEVDLYNEKQKLVDWGKSTLPTSALNSTIAEDNPKIKDVTKPGNNVTLKIRDVCSYIILTPPKKLEAEAVSASIEAMPKLSDPSNLETFSANLPLPLPIEIHRIEETTVGIPAAIAA